MTENGKLTGEKKDQLSGETDEGGNSYDIIGDHMANSAWWVIICSLCIFTGETSGVTLGGVPAVGRAPLITPHNVGRLTLQPHLTS